jgi:hypothetical protein
MRWIPTLIVIVSASTLAACGASTGSVDPVGAGVRADPAPVELTTLVTKPPPLADGRKASVVKALAEAYTAARVCRVRHEALVRFYVDRDARLRGAAAPRSTR